MSTSKAYKMANTPEFQEYEEALKLYKAQSKLFHNFRFNLGDSPHAAAELMMLKARRDYAEQCKEFAKARSKYKAACAMQQLGGFSNSFGLKLEDVVALLGIDTHVAMKDLIDTKRKAALKATFKEGEIDKLMQEVEAIRKASEVNNEFLSDPITRRQNAIGKDHLEDSAVLRPQEAESEQVEQVDLLPAHSVSDDPTKEF